MTSVDVAVIGGGYTGAMFAIHLVRMADRPLAIAVVEPDAEPGRGLAYGINDLDHRLNGPAANHSPYPDSEGHTLDWYLNNGYLDRDPDAFADGQIFMRRGDFGRYMTEQFEAHCASNPSGSRLHHLRDRALGLTRTTHGFKIELERGEPFDTRLVVVATTFERPAVPAPFSALADTRPAFIGDPWDTERLAAIAPDARVLVLGMAQTASDVMAVLLRDNRLRSITSLSRRGLRPRKRPSGPAGSPGPAFSRLDRPTSLFVERHGRLDTVLSILRALRADVKNAESAGGFWPQVFDELRDSVWDVWPALPLAEKRRFMRHLRIWYDVHRFRLPPQIEARIEAAEANGQITFVAASVRSARPDGSRIAVTMRQRRGNRDRTATFDAVVNCTGPASDPTRSPNRFLRNLIDQGDVRPHPLGIGLDVDPINRAVNADGTADPRLYVVGPLTYAAFADQQGAPFIASRLCKIIPNVVATLSTS